MDFRNKGTIARSHIIAVLELIAGGFGTFFWGVGLGMCLTQTYGFRLTDLFFPVLGLIPHIWLLRAGFRRRVYIGKVNRFNSLLTSDADGVRRVKDLAQDLSQQEENVIRDLEWLLSHRYLNDCSLERGSDPTVYLKMTEKPWVAKMIQVRCPNCGAFLKMREGTTGKCEYCDAPVHAEEKE